MLTVHHLNKSYGVEPILKDISFSLNAGERWGLVGPNGCGKSTLLRIICGQEAADSGHVQFNPPDLRPGYLPQGITPADEDTLEHYLNPQQDSLQDLSVHLQQAAIKLADNPQQPRIQEEYDRLLAQISAQSDITNHMPAVLASLGLGDMPLDTPVSILSGGQKTRLVLAGVLLNNPQLLLLDEPTNHLDIAMLAWLEDWLEAYRGGALIVSHDRTFLDNTVTGILELDAVSHIIKAYAGNYSAYIQQKENEQAHHRQQYQDQQLEIRRLKRAAGHTRGLAKMRKGGKADDGDKFAKGFFANRSRGTVQRAQNIEKRVERLLNEDCIDKPLQGWQMKVDFTDTPASGRDVLVLEDLAVGYGEKVLLRDINQTVRFGTRLVLTGANGSGKTTLLKTIIGLIPPLAGRARLGANVRVGYMAQEQETLDAALNVLETLQQYAAGIQTEARSFLHKFLFKGDDVFIPVGNLSYGERARLYLACLVASNCNFLIMDEPINHMDIPSRSRFEEALRQFEGTVLAVVHDRHFIRQFASALWEVKDGRNVVS